MDVELKITVCFILKSASWWVEAITHTPFNFLFFPTTFIEKQRAAEGLNGHLVIWHLHRSLHNKITVYKLILTVKACSSLLSVAGNVGKEEFKYCWHVVKGQKGTDSAEMPRSVRPRVCSSSADSGTVSGRCCWMRLNGSGRSLCSSPLLLLQHLLLLH